MSLLDQPSSDAQIASAVEFASFENLKRREAADFFASERLRAVDKADPDTFKVRRGTVGGWRDYFDPTQQAVIDGLVEGQLPAALHYGLPAAAPPPAHTRRPKS
jgi:hypothetical protein